MALHMMLISTASSKVKRTRKMKKVRMTDAYWMSDTPTQVGSMSWMVHG